MLRGGGGASPPRRVFGRLPIINSINLKLPGQRCDDGDKDFLIKDDNIGVCLWAVMLLVVRIFTAQHCV